MRNIKCYSAVLGGIVMAAATFYALGSAWGITFSGPGSCTPPNACPNQKTGVSSNFDYGVATSSASSSVRFYVRASTTDVNYSALNIVSASGTLLLVRNDGRILVNTATFPPAASSTRLRVDGMIETQTGGLQFPDGTTQTTQAGVASVTATNVSAGVFASGTFSYPANLTVGGLLAATSTLAVGTTTAPTNSAIAWFNGNVGIGTSTPNAKLSIVNNVATGFLDTYAEYQEILYNGGTASLSYGLGVKDYTLVLNSGGGAFSFDKAGASSPLTIDTAGLVTVANRITGVSTPTGSSDVATKAYVDTAFASTSQLWAGYSTSSYTGGAFGAYKGAQQICNANYPSSTPVGIDDAIRLGSKFPWTSNAWLIIGANGGNGALNCIGYTSSAISDTGVYFDSITGQFQINQACNGSYKLACSYKHWIKPY